MKDRGWTWVTVGIGELLSEGHGLWSWSYLWTFSSSPTCPCWQWDSLLCWNQWQCVSTHPSQCPLGRLKSGNFQIWLPFMENMWQNAKPWALDWGRPSLGPLKLLARNYKTSTRRRRDDIEPLRIGSEARLFAPSCLWDLDKVILATLNFTFLFYQVRSIPPISALLWRLHEIPASENKVWDVGLSLEESQEKLMTATGRKSLPKGRRNDLGGEGRKRTVQTEIEVSTVLAPH